MTSELPRIPSGLSPPGRSLSSPPGRADALSDRYGRVLDWLEGHLRLALGLFVLSRALPYAARLALLLGPHLERPYDIVKTWQAASLAGQGLFPYMHYWSEYPPLYPWLSVLFYGVSRLLPLGPDGRLTFYALVGAVLIAAEVGVILLVYRLTGRMFAKRAAAQAALLYGVISVPVYLYVGWFDTIPAFFFVLALDRLMARRETQSAVVAALGGLAKLFPCFAVPIAWRVLRTWHERLAYTAVSGGLALASMLPLVLANPAMTLAWAQATLVRSSWETIWALLEGYTSFGLVAPLEARTDPASASFQAHPSWLPWPLITLALVALLAWLYTRPLNLTRPRNVVALAGLSISMFLLFNKGYSPQFLLWVLPLLFITFPDRTGFVYGALLAAVNLVEYPIYIPRLIETAPWVLVSVVLGRTTLLIGLCLAYWRVLRSSFDGDDGEDGDDGAHRG